MCYHKSLVQKYNELMDHYSASFSSINEELELIKERFSIMMARDVAQNPYSKEETKELAYLQKTISSFGETEFRRYHENGFDHLAMPIITAGVPEEFKLFRWGLIPYNIPTKEAAMELRTRTLNCISEEMYDKPSFKDAANNAQRCLIPISGFYESRHVLNAKGKVESKIPYLVSLKNQSLASIGGLYSRWKDRTTGLYYYSYSVLTTRANPKMEYVHNSKMRMPVIIPREFEKDWLNKNLSKEDVLALCEPVKSESMHAHTVSKLVNAKNVETNVEEVVKLHNYEKVGTEEIIAEL